ncbi:MAG TPA: Hsp20/alpha crystallin family protein [Flavobacteriales bacterium]|nr:Hsp20/alpha crystallin family protein [Flavobacteriales bacterium]
MELVKSNGTTFPNLLSDFFNNDFFSPRWMERELERSLPAVNIKENKDSFSIEFAAPGFNKADFKIDVESTILTVSAEKKEEKSEEKDRFTRKEFSYNSFSRSFTLPQTVIGDKIDAKYQDGILKLSIPKKEEAKQLPKKEIKVA